RRASQISTLLSLLSTDGLERKIPVDIYKYNINITSEPILLRRHVSVVDCAVSSSCSLHCQVWGNSRNSRNDSRNRRNTSLHPALQTLLIPFGCGKPCEDQHSIRRPHKPVVDWHGDTEWSACRD